MPIEDHIVKTYLGPDAYYAHCSCGVLDVKNENWVVVASAIGGHLNQGLGPSKRAVEGYYQR